jgi:histidine ammonia-lyase
MGVTAGLKLRQIIDNVEGILAIELMCAAQGVDFRRKALGKTKKLGRGTGAAYALIRGEIPFIEEDRLLKPYMDAAADLVRSGRLVARVNRALRN